MAINRLTKILFNFFRIMKSLFSFAPFLEKMEKKDLKEIIEESIKVKKTTTHIQNNKNRASILFVNETWKYYSTHYSSRVNDLILRFQSQDGF